MGSDTTHDAPGDGVPQSPRLRLRYAAMSDVGRHLRSSSTVLPMRTCVPRVSVVGWVIRTEPM